MGPIISRTVAFCNKRGNVDASFPLLSVLSEKRIGLTINIYTTEVHAK